MSLGRGLKLACTRISRASDGSPGRQRDTPRRATRVCHVGAMQHFVEGQGKEAPAKRRKLLLASFGRGLSRLVEILFAQRLQQIQVLLAQLKILLSNLGERRIGAGIRDGFGVLAKVLLPLCSGILVSEKYRRDRALKQREMAEDPERVAAAVRCRKSRCGAAHLINYAEHRSIRNGQREFNGLFRLHLFSSWNCLPLSITIPGGARIRVVPHSLVAAGHDDGGR